MRSASLRHSSGLSVGKCGAAGCYLLLCLPRSPPLRVRPSGFICANVGSQGLLVLRLPAPFVPHSASLSPATATRFAPPRCPSPPLLLVWMNGYFLFSWCWSPLLFDSLSVLIVRGGAVCLPTPPSWFSRSFFLVLNFIPLSACVTVYLPIHLLKDIFVASKFEQF